MPHRVSSMQRWSLFLALLAAISLHHAGAADAGLRAKQRHSEASDGTGLRVSAGDAQKTEPFDMDPATFMGTLKSVSTDVLLLFYSPTCSDCEKLMPQWAKIAGALDGRQDLTLLTVADTEGRAPGRFHHGENPALFFVPRDHKDDPVPFSLGKLHAFIDTTETPATQVAIRKDITEFAMGHLTDAPKGASQIAASHADDVPAAQDQADANESMLTAKLLVALRNHEQGGRDVQMELLKSPAFAKLPVAQAMTLLKPEDVREPLAVIAARFLDEEAQAKHAAADYAKWYLKTTGQDRLPIAEYRKRFADIEAYDLPSQLKSIFESVRRRSR